MKTTIWKIKIYLSPLGQAPFSEWLNSLKDLLGRAKIRVGIDRLSLGNFGNCRALGKGMFELKINFGPGYRIYYGQEGKNIIVLLCGGAKKTQQRDIEQARDFWNDYRRRSK